jgi:methylase of polypeptide subunit release factors
LLSCLAEYQKATGLGVDVSEKALVIARQNAEKLSLWERANFITSDWNEMVEGQFDIILCNPPYVKTGEFLDESVLFDPHIALFGGSDGLDCYREIFKRLHKNLKYEEPSKVYLANSPLTDGNTPCLTFGEQREGVNEGERESNGRTMPPKSRSKILVEIGIGQGEAVEGLAKAEGLRLLKVVYDLQKIPRVLVFEAEACAR